MDVKELMKPFRTRIDALDAELVALLGKRFGVIREVATFKASKGIPAIIPERVVEVRENAVAIGAKHGLDEEFMRKLYTLIIEYSCEIEEREKRG